MKKNWKVKIISLIAAAGILANSTQVMAVSVFAGDFNEAEETLLESTSFQPEEEILLENTDLDETIISSEEEFLANEEMATAETSEEEASAVVSDIENEVDAVPAEENESRTEEAEETASNDTVISEKSEENEKSTESSEDSVKKNTEDETAPQAKEEEKTAETAEADKDITEPEAESDEDEMCFRHFKVNAGSGQKVVLDGVVPKESEVSAVDVTNQKEYEDSLVAMDITITNDGEEYQPDEENPVTVQITSKTIDESKKLKLWHIKDDGTREEVKDFTVEGNTICFEATGFSVYEITDEDGNIVTPRAVYHFRNEDGTAAGIDDQIIKNQEWLHEVRAAEYDNKVFLGWYIYENGQWGEPVQFETQIQVIFGSEKAIYGNSVVVPHTYGKDKTEYVDVYVRARYTTDYATIYYLKDTVGSYTDANVVKQTEKVGFHSGEKTIDYSIPDVTKLSVLSANTEYEFVGWSTVKPSRESVYYSESDNREVLTALSIQKGKTYVLYPVFKKAHWMFFKTAPVGYGADYVAPAFVANGDAASTKRPADPAWRGYKFLYWTETPTYDEEKGELITFNKGQEPKAFDFNKKLSENVTLYAYWESGYTTYTVIFWKQKVTDDKNAPADKRTYEFASQENRDAKVGAVVNLKKEDLSKKYEGFHHKTEQDVLGDIHTDSENVKVAASGSSVLNVYYDRDVITMKFYNGSSAPLGGYNDPVYDSEYDGYVVATSDEGIQYAKVGDGYEVLTREEETTVTYVWKDKYGDTYDESKIYTKSGSKYTAYNGNYNPKTTYYGYDSYYRIYYVVTRSESRTTVYKWYLNDSLYEDTRYTEDASGAYFVYNGLYGQSLENCGYSWPSGMWYYYNADNGQTGMSFLGEFVLPDGVRDESGREIRLFKNSNAMTKIYFYLQNPDGSYPNTPSDTGNGTGGNFMFSEKYDGYTVSSYKRVYTDTWGKTVNVDSDWISAKNSDGSFKSVATSSSRTYYTLMVRYERRSYDISYYDSMDGQPLTVLLKNGAAVQYQRSIRYGSGIDGYFPSPAYEPNAKQPGYAFNDRWYSDRGQTIQFFFHENGNTELTAEEENLLWYYVDQSGEKIYSGSVPSEAELAREDRTYERDQFELLTAMPMRNLAVYAGFTHVWYWVKIDVNGGELDPDKDYSTYFWEQYGGTIEEYPISRDYIRDDTGSYYYHYAEFNSADPDGSQPYPRKAYYTTDASQSTDGGLRYRKAGEHEGYDFVGWYLVNADGSLTPYSFGSIVTGNTTLRAVWRQKGSFQIYYSKEKAMDRNGNEITGFNADSFKEAPAAPVDDFRYAENATVVVKSGTVEAKDNEYRFVGWYFNNRVLQAGDVFTANPLLAEKNPMDDQDDAPYDTFILYPVFVKGDASNESDDDVLTKLILDSNGGRKTDGYILPKEAAVNDDGSVVTLTWANLKVNESITLPETQSAGDIFTKENAEFLGWAFSKDAKTPVFKAGQRVGIDNLEGAGYNGDNTNILYAVWRLKEVSIKIRNVDELSAASPLSGSEFVFHAGSNSLPLSTGSDGYLSSSDSVKVFDIATPSTRTDVLTYALEQTKAPDGYLELNGNVQISVDYEGNVSFRQENGEWEEAIYEGGSYLVVVKNKKIPAPTGYSSEKKPYGWMIAAGIVIAALLIVPVVLKRRKEEEAE